MSRRQFPLMKEPLFKIPPFWAALSFLTAAGTFCFAIAGLTCRDAKLYIGSDQSGTVLTPKATPIMFWLSIASFVALGTLCFFGLSRLILNRLANRDKHPVVGSPCALSSAFGIPTAAAACPGSIIAAISSFALHPVAAMVYELAYRTKGSLTLFALITSVIWLFLLSRFRSGSVAVLWVMCVVFISQAAGLVPDLVHGVIHHQQVLAITQLAALILGFFFSLRPASLLWFWRKRDPTVVILWVVLRKIGYVSEKSPIIENVNHPTVEKGGEGQ